VSAIKDNRQRPVKGGRSIYRIPARRFSGRVVKGQETAATIRRSVLAGMLLSVFVCCLLLAAARTAQAGDELGVPIKPLAQIKVDDDGRPLGYPTAVFFDPIEEETYVVNGGSNRVVVYGPDYFPRVSIGIGRGVVAPRGGEVMSNGEVYLCQRRTAKSQSYRITILNGAFFVDREIILDDIPEAAGFIPRQVAVSSDGIIYLAGENYRGLLVLDNDGNYLRKIQPTDKISVYAAEELAKLKTEQEKPAEPEPQSPESAEGEAAKVEEEANTYADIPEEFRPRSSQQGDTGGKQELVGPVKLNYVFIDSHGKIYMISAETGKVYVYGPDESFLFSFGVKGGSPRQMSQPRALTIDEKRGLIYVVDYMRHTILTYDMNGKFMFELGGRGYAPGWFNFPSGIAINKQGQIIVSDLFNKRVQVIEVQYDDVAYMFKGELPPGTELEGSDGEDTEAAGQSEADIKVEQEAEPTQEATNGSEVKEVIIQDDQVPTLPDAANDQEKSQDSGAGEK